VAWAWSLEILSIVGPWNHHTGPFFPGIDTKVITNRNIDFDVEKDLRQSVFVKKLYFTSYISQGDFTQSLYWKSDLCVHRNETAWARSNSYIHVSVSALYIPRIGLFMWLQQNKQTDPGNI
jgi:hypothetical protein